MSSLSLRPDRQRGATLIVALTVVIVVGLLATSVSHDFLVQTRRVENRTQAQQVQAWLVGAEAVARQALMEDLRISPEVDYALDAWAQTLELALPVGQLHACLVDLQGRINLNALATPATDGYSSDQRRFIRLLQAIDLADPLTQTESIMLANAVFDWIDPDDNQRFPGGAEDLFYFQQEPAGKTANQSFASVSELRLIRGMTADIVAALTPHVTLWGNGFLNINSADGRLTRDRLQGIGADRDAPAPVVLRTLNSEDQLVPLNEETARQIAERRIDAGGFGEDDIAALGQLAGVAIEDDGLGLGSEYFGLAGEVFVDGRRYQLQSVLHRTIDGLGIPGVRVVSRKLVNNRIRMDEFCVN